MERLTKKNASDEGFWTEEDETNEVYLKLKRYEDLEERLEKVYGKCDGMLETLIGHLEKHKGVNVGNPGKSLLLTDDDADRWNEYNKIGTVEEVREAVEKQKPKKD